MSERRITVFDTGDHIPNDGPVFFWRRQPNQPSGKSLLNIIDSDKVYFRNLLLKILHDHAKLALAQVTNCRNSNEADELLVWMSSLFERSPFKSSCVSDGARLLCLREQIIKFDCSEICYIGDNSKVAESIQVLCERYQKTFIWPVQPLRKHSLERIFSTSLLPHSIKALAVLIKLFWQRRYFLPQKNKAQSDEKNSALFFSYLSHVEQTADQKTPYVFRQWGELPDLVADLGFTVKWIHLYSPSGSARTSKQALHLLEQLNGLDADQGTHAFLDSYATFPVWMNIIKDVVRALSRSRLWRQRVTEHILASEYGFVWPVFRDEWIKSMIGGVSVEHIYWNRIFERAYSKVPRQSLGLYLQENQGWERAFIRNWRKYGHGTLIGYAHSTIRFWDLRYFDLTFPRIGPASMVSDYHPDKSAIGGPLARKVLHGANAISSRHIDVEALRYIGLLKSRSLRNLPHRSVPADYSIQVLILGDISAKSTAKMMMQIDGLPSSITRNIKFKVRPHPNNPINVSEYPNIDAEVTDQTISILALSATFAITTAQTSSVLDAICNGIPTIYTPSPDDLDYSAFSEIPGAVCVQSDLQFSTAISNMLDNTPTFPSPTGIFFLDSVLPRWRTTLSAIPTVK